VKNGSVSTLNNINVPAKGPVASINTVSLILKSVRIFQTLLPVQSVLLNLNELTEVPIGNNPGNSIQPGLFTFVPPLESLKLTTFTQDDVKALVGVGVIGGVELIVGVTVGVVVFVGVGDGLLVGVFVGVSVGVLLGVLVGVSVVVGVNVGVGVIVEVGVGLAQVTNDSITPLEKLTKEKFGVVNKIL